MPDTATLNKRMCISHCLDQHPILQYPIDFKINYLKILQYFCEGYCTDDKFTFAMFENYKKKSWEMRIIPISMIRLGLKTLCAIVQRIIIQSINSLPVVFHY